MRNTHIYGNTEYRLWPGFGRGFPFRRAGTTFIRSATPDRPYRRPPMSPLIATLSALHRRLRAESPRGSVRFYFRPPCNNPRRLCRYPPPRKKPGGPKEESERESAAPILSYLPSITHIHTPRARHRPPLFARILSPPESIESHYRLISDRSHPLLPLFRSWLASDNDFIATPCRRYALASKIRVGARVCLSRIAPVGRPGRSVSIPFEFRSALARGILDDSI